MIRNTRYPETYILRPPTPFPGGENSLGNGIQVLVAKPVNFTCYPKVWTRVSDSSLQLGFEGGKDLPVLIGQLVEFLLQLILAPCCAQQSVDGGG